MISNFTFILVNSEQVIKDYSRHIKNKDNKADKRVFWSIISFLLAIYVYVSLRDILHQIQEASLNPKDASWN